MIRKPEIFPPKSVAKCPISQAKASEMFCSFFYFFLEQNFRPKNVHIDELKYLSFFSAGPLLIIPGVILAIFDEFSTDFRHFNLSFFGFLVDLTTKVLSPKRYILSN